MSYWAQRDRATTHSRCFLLILFVLLAAAMPAVESMQYRPPRNEFGQPDLAGVWNFSSDVPLERPKELADKAFFTKEELEQQRAAREKTLDSLATAMTAAWRSVVSLARTPRLLSSASFEYPRTHSSTKQRSWTVRHSGTRL